MHAIIPSAAPLSRLRNCIRFHALNRKSNPALRAYLLGQWKRSLAKISQRSRIERTRKAALTTVLASVVDLRRIGTALAIGCRDAYELDLLEGLGVRRVTGIDFHSSDRRIKVMDMHDLRFADHAFDLVYASHSPEHAYDTDRVLSEIVRVVRHGGFVLIEVPVNYPTGEVDRHDFRNAQALLDRISAHAGTVRPLRPLLKKTVAKRSDGNASGTDVARVIVRIGNG